MKEKVLVLNQDFSAIAVCNVHKAFVLIYLDKAELINKAENGILRTISKSYPVPSVIRLQKYVRVPYHGISLNRHNILRRDNYSCQYCGAIKDLTLDHLMPRSRGGETDWMNLVTACMRCNTRKGDRTPEEAGLKLKKQPVRPTLQSFLQLHLNIHNKEWGTYLGKAINK
jgi:5-methylcytosine-specific restriction endonuclease McrA